MTKDWGYVVLTAEAAKNYVDYKGPNFHEVSLADRQRAKKYRPSTAVRVVECMYDAVASGRPVPKVWLSAQAVFEDGSLIPGCPSVRYTAPPNTKMGQIPELPEVPPVVQLADGTWRKVPEMHVKYSSNGTYCSVPYAFLYKNSPVSGYFEAQTRKDVFEAIFNTTNDAKSDGHGGWLNPANPQAIGEPTREQIYRAMLPVADATEVQRYLDLVAARDAAIAAAEAEKYREPSEQEIQAADVRPETIGRMPADLFKARYLSDKAFRYAYDRREAFEKAMREKEHKEAAAAADRQAIDHGLKVLALREQGIVSER
jgi:hypothetical protein